MSKLCGSSVTAFLSKNCKNGVVVTYYVNKKTRENITYSIDMLRLKTEITKEDFSRLEFRFMTCWKAYVKNSYQTTRAAQFHYNYVLEAEEGKSFWIGFLHNQESKSMINESKKYNFTIEFNPNKLKEDECLISILQMFSNWSLKSFDIALDIPVNINSLIIDRGRFNLLQTLDYGMDNKTFFLGRGDGRVKIYNKKRESNLDVNELTRVEVSGVETGDMPLIFLDKYTFEDRLFPLLYVKEYVFSLEDYQDTTLLAILYAVQNGYDINLLTKTYKRKVRELLKKGSQIKFESKVVEEVLKETIGRLMNYDKKERY